MTRRKKGTGTTYERNGLWVAQIDFGFDPVTGKRNRPTLGSDFPTEEAANQAIAKAREEYKAGLFNTTVDTKLADYIASWLQEQEERFEVGDIEESTLIGYRDSMNRVVPYLGSLRIRDLTPEVIRRWHRKLRVSGGRNGTGIAASTVAHSHSMLRYAIEDAHLPSKNPLDGVKPPRRESDRIKPQRDVVEKILDHVKGCRYGGGPRLHALWHLASRTGARRGELLGLSWNHIDLGERVMRVECQLTEPTYSRLVLKPYTKTRRPRVVGLDNTTVAVLRKHRAHLYEERLAFGDRYVTDPGPGFGNLVFRSPDGSPLSPNHVSAYFKTHLGHLGIDKVVLHGLRGSLMSLLVHHGVNLADISGQVGAKPSTIMRSYLADIDPTRPRRVGDKVETIYRAGGL